MRKCAGWFESSLALMPERMFLMLRLREIKNIPKKIDIDIATKLSLKETICMTCQSLLFEKIRISIVNFSSDELAQRVVKP